MKTNLDKLREKEDILEEDVIDLTCKAILDDINEIIPVGECNGIKIFEEIKQLLKGEKNEKKINS